MKNFKFNLESIISLWQDPYYSDILLNYYSIVNGYLNTGKVYISEKKLEELGLTMGEITDFTIKYINSLINILYKVPRDSTILYRGELRSDLKIKVNDILLYKNFHATSDSISFAFNFSKYSYNETKFDKTRLVLALKIPNGFYYLKLDRSLKYINKDGINEYYNEFEYLIPPNCYYQVTDVVNLSHNVKLVKAILIKQEKFIISEPGLNYLYTPIQPQIKKSLSDFRDPNVKSFIEEFKRYYQSIEILYKLKDYHIPNDLFQMLKSNLYRNFFNLNTSLIIEYARQINDNNFLNIMYTLEQLGFPYSKKDLVKPERYINRLKALASSNIMVLNYVDDMKVYYSENNFTSTLEIPSLIKLLEEQPEGRYKYILECSAIPDCFYYNCVTNDIYPNCLLEKNKKKTLIYTKYIIEFQISNVKIAISDQCKNLFNNQLLLIPNFDYKVLSKSKSKNKFGKDIVIYKVQLQG